MAKNFASGLDKIAARIMNAPRELPGWAIRAFETVVEEWAGPTPAEITTDWYQRATVPSYDSTVAAAAYLGAYGPRSFLKYQEALLALLNRIGSVATETRILDFGAGPCVGYPACGMLWRALSEALGEELTVVYYAVDRSEPMLDVGRRLGELVQNELGTSARFMVVDSLPNVSGQVDILIISNVMNEGEGVSDCAAFVAGVIEQVGSVPYMLAIEPASEQPSRQMCSLGRLTGMRSLGPCCHAREHCAAWSFRQFSKRLYNVERLCLGDRAAAARSCKYSLAILSGTDISTDKPGVDFGTVLREPSITGVAEVCYRTGCRHVRVPSGVTAWDCIDSAGNVIGWWPR